MGTVKRRGSSPCALEEGSCLGDQMVCSPSASLSLQHEPRVLMQDPSSLFFKRGYLQAPVSSAVLGGRVDRRPVHSTMLSTMRAHHTPLFLLQRSTTEKDSGDFRRSPEKQRCLLRLRSVFWMEAPRLNSSSWDCSVIRQNRGE